jgi:serine/threonine-protein kinase HipA
MDREVLVYVDLDGVPHLTGRLWNRLRKNKESATFEYNPDWLRHRARLALEPALTLGPGAFHTAPTRLSLVRLVRLGAGSMGARAHAAHVAAGGRARTPRGSHP